MGTTSNYSWPYPESTDFVADGATAIENLADAIDTTAGGWGTWTTYTPTVTSGTGTLGSYTSAGDYCRINDLVVVQFETTITNNGTGATDIRVSLPIASTSAVGNPNIGGAIEDAIGGAFVQIQLASGVAILRSVSYTYPGGGSGRRFRGTVTYKAA